MSNISPNFEFFRALRLVNFDFQTIINQLVQNNIQKKKRLLRITQHNTEQGCKEIAVNLEESQAVFKTFAVKFTKFLTN